MTQIPHSIILFNAFEVLNAKESANYNKYDEVPFIYKFFNRFGASTLAMTLAVGLTYPLDTLKRRLQIDGARGYTKTHLTEVGLARQIYANEGVKSFYRGFTPCLLRNVPLAFI